MIRRLFVAALFALMIITPAAVTTAAPVPAAPPPVTVETAYMYYYDYWSDSSYTTLVGQAWRQCDLTYRMMWGQETPYMTYDLEGCW
ncbi:MAG TPA: hypothetical protein VGD69_20740 [Herpetosiphonaceae bacterium]